MFWLSSSQPQGMKEMQTLEGSYLRELIKSIFSQAHLVYLFTLLLTLFVKLNHSISQKTSIIKGILWHPLKFTVLNLLANLVIFEKIRLRLRRS